MCIVDKRLDGLMLKPSGARLSMESAFICCDTIAKLKKVFSTLDYKDRIEIDWGKNRLCMEIKTFHANVEHILQKKKKVKIIII